MPFFLPLDSIFVALTCPRDATLLFESIHGIDQVSRMNDDDDDAQRNRSSSRHMSNMCIRRSLSHLVLH